METFLSLYQTDRHRFLAIAKKITGDADDAEDAVNDAFIILIRFNTTHIDNLVAYATRVVQSKALDILSKKKRKKEVSTDEPIEDASELSEIDRVDQVEEDEFWAQCGRDAVIYLSDDDSRIIQIYCEEEHYIDVIATEFRIKKSSAKVRLYHARKNFAFLSRLAAIRRGRNELLQAIVELTHTGDCVYHEINRGLNRFTALKEPESKRDQSIKDILMSLIKLTQSIHFALRKQELGEDSKPLQFRRMIFDLLGEETELTNRLTYKNESATVRLTESVHKHLEESGQRVEIQVLRQEFKESHQLIQKSVNQSKAATTNG